MTITKDDIPYTLLPFSPDWSIRPRQVTTWDTEIEKAVRGYETRGQLRSAPRVTLTLAISFCTPGEYGEFCNLLAQGFRVDHAIAHLPGANAGVAQFAVPWAGRESWPVAFTADTVTIEPTPWAWAVGDWAVVFAEDESYSVCQVTAVAGSLLSLNHQLSTLNCVLPLFFGRLEPPATDIDSPIHTRCELTLHGDRYVLPEGVPLACAGEPAWPNPPACTPPVAVATATVMGMVASFSGVTSTPGTSPVDGVTAVPLVGYEWQFGDGAEAVGITAEHEYAVAGVYRVVLIVRDELRRFDEAVITVTIEEPVDPYSELGGGTP